jgi:hypothetical protein
MKFKKSLHRVGFEVLTAVSTKMARGLLIALMMEAARTSETSANFYQTTRCYNPEDSHLSLHRVLRNRIVKKYTCF